MAKPEQNKVLRRLPLAVGSLGGILLLINRFVTPELTDSQARSDALGVILSALLILTGLLWEQIQPRSPDAVVLIGSEGFELAPNLPEIVQKELAWASHLLLTNTVTRSLVVWYGERVLLRRGILGPNPQVKPGPILQRVLEKQKPIYLVDLKLYPGRIEFDYLPENTQGVIIQPIGNRGALILAANAPRSYTKQDENWIEGIADKLADTLSNFSSLHDFQSHETQSQPSEAI
ncbi:MAG: cofactor assembly of complex C subunit B [Oscillatoriaceae bacterium SKW80]|nr:cofactor assembly of complex C subunit B [Oscillatoriaceae bacterium SKYG93]MCX8121140.1 cofactor assembly of complex C subunit B [Oscillatoriaceae bacterium SKW80]MDW8453530.1 cofactor assembly of complex C subunit B [Oscillatoriaceae cyanobacterium SKYGB_i_bin93]HIK26880.1 cofactor assembly of complex C subunit B [Oscillatoriaceae cyanobacterium M7585_C2015_266]